MDRQLLPTLDRLRESIRARDPDTSFYFAGPRAGRAALDAAMPDVAGGADVWIAATEALRARNHWAELLFD